MVRIVFILEIITVTLQWAVWCLKSPVSQLFAQPFVQGHIKQNIKAPCHRPLWGAGGFPSQRDSKWKMFPFNDAIMITSQFQCPTPGGRLTKAYDVTIQRYRNLHAKIEDSKIHILRCMGSKFCVKFQRFPLKFHTKFWTHTTQNMHFTRC